MFRQVNAIFRGLHVLYKLLQIFCARADVDYGSFGVVSCCGICWPAAVEFVGQLPWNLLVSCRGICWSAAVEFVGQLPWNLLVTCRGICWSSHTETKDARSNYKDKTVIFISVLSIPLCYFKV
jgi:hypothetical protein